MSENPRRGRQARNFTTNVRKILDLKLSSEQIFFRKLSLGAPAGCLISLDSQWQETPSTCAVILMPLTKPHVIHIGDSAIEMNDFLKNLGVFIYNKLSTTYQPLAKISSLRPLLRWQRG